jgi:hypothetical protein
MYITLAHKHSTVATRLFHSESYTYTVMRVYFYILSLYAMFLLLYITGEFLGCYAMISGFSSWCEPILTLF